MLFHSRSSFSFLMKGDRWWLLRTVYLSNNSRTTQLENHQSFSSILIIMEILILIYMGIRLVLLILICISNKIIHRLLVGLMVIIKLFTNNNNHNKCSSSNRFINNNNLLKIIKIKMRFRGNNKFLLKNRKEKI